MSPRLPCPSALDVVLCVAVGLVSALPYLNSLHGNFCYDDKVAVGGNPDVVMPNVTMRDILTHDFWGNDILRRRCARARRARARRNRARAEPRCSARARARSRASAPSPPPLSIPPAPAAGRTIRGVRS
jgi:hypothetical protein